MQSDLTQLYVVRDIVVEEYGPLFEAVNEPGAIRAYKKLLNESSMDVNDYELWKIGTFRRESISHGAMPLHNIVIKILIPEVEIEENAKS